MRTAVAVFLTAGLFLGIAAVAIATVTGPTDVKTTSAEEQGPAATADWFAWTQRPLAHPNRPAVYAEGLPNVPGDAFKVNPSGTRAWTGGIDGDTLVYQQIENGQSNVRLFDLVTKTDIGGGGANTSNWEWHPTISTDTNIDQWILFGRQNLRTGVQRVIARNVTDGFNRVLGEVLKFRHSAIPGQINGDWATWTICKSSCNVWYVNLVDSSSAVKIPKPTAYHQYASSVTPDGVVYFVKSGNACGKNVKIARFDDTTQTTTPIIDLSSGRDIFFTYTSQEGTDNHVYYDRVVCSTGHWNIYKVVESP